MHVVSMRCRQPSAGATHLTVPPRYETQLRDRDSDYDRMVTHTRLIQLICGGSSRQGTAWVVWVWRVGYFQPQRQPMNDWEAKQLQARNRCSHAGRCSCIDVPNTPYGHGTESQRMDGQLRGQAPVTSGQSCHIVA